MSTKLKNENLKKGEKNLFAQVKAPQPQLESTPFPSNMHPGYQSPLDSNGNKVLSIKWGLRGMTVVKINK